MLIDFRFSGTTVCVLESSLVELSSSALPRVSRSRAGTRVAGRISRRRWSGGRCQRVRSRWR
jgi:hypothetical protein